MSARRLLAALSVVALAACSGGSSGDGASSEKATLAELAGLDGTLSDALVARAEDEGALSIYTSNSDLEDMAKVFGDRFGIRVSVYRASSEAMVQRLLQESSAGRHDADLVETHISEMTLLSQGGVLVPYDAGLDDDLRPGSVYPDWTADRLNVFTIAWNTDVLGAEPPPSRWEDLADPKWDDRLALEAGDYDWYVTLRNFLVDEGRTEGEADKVMADIAGGARVVDGHTAQAELLAAGEFTLAASAYSHSIEDRIDAGAPVAWQPAVEPVIVKPAGVALVKGLRHPAASALFYEWMLTDAQELLVTDHRVPSSLAFDDPLAGLDVINVDAELLARDAETWSSRYQDLLR